MFTYVYLFIQKDHSKRLEHQIEIEKLESILRNNKGECFKKQGKYGDALEEFKASLELNGDLECTTVANSITLCNMGRLYYKISMNSEEVSTTK